MPGAEKMLPAWQQGGGNVVFLRRFLNRALKFCSLPGAEKLIMK